MDLWHIPVAVKVSRARYIGFCQFRLELSMVSLKLGLGLGCIGVCQFWLELSLVTLKPGLGLGSASAPVFGIVADWTCLTVVDEGVSVGAMELRLSLIRSE